MICPIRFRQQIRRGGGGGGGGRGGRKWRLRSTWMIDRDDTYARTYTRCAHLHASLEVLSQFSIVLFTYRIILLVTYIQHLVGQIFFEARHGLARRNCVPKARQDRTWLSLIRCLVAPAVVRSVWLPRRPNSYICTCKVLVPGSVLEARTMPLIVLLQVNCWRNLNKGSQETMVPISDIQVSIMYKGLHVG